MQDKNTTQDTKKTKQSKHEQNVNLFIHHSSLLTHSKLLRLSSSSAHNHTCFSKTIFKKLSFLKSHLKSNYEDVKLSWKLKMIISSQNCSLHKRYYFFAFFRQAKESTKPATSTRHAHAFSNCLCLLKKTICKHKFIRTYASFHSS